MARRPKARIAPGVLLDLASASKATPAELAAYLRKSEQTLANWRWLGKGPRYQGKGRGILYDWADVYEWEKGLPSGGAGIRRGAA